MFIQVRLYAVHDYDLLVYMTLPYMKLDDIIHACVCAYVRKQSFSIPAPIGIDCNVQRKDKRICVTFDDDLDADVIAWLKQVKFGYLNSVIKLITRSYLSSDLLRDIFLENGEATEPVSQVNAKTASSQSKPVTETRVKTSPKPKKVTPKEVPDIPEIQPNIPENIEEPELQTDKSLDGEQDAFDMFDSMIF